MEKSFFFRKLIVCFIKSFREIACSLGIKTEMKEHETTDEEHAETGEWGKLITATH